MKSKNVFSYSYNLWIWVTVKRSFLSIDTNTDLSLSYAKSVRQMSTDDGQETIIDFHQNILFSFGVIFIPQIFLLIHKRISRWMSGKCGRTNV